MIQVAYIEWLDATGISGRISKKNAHKEGLLLLQTAGFLVSQDEEVIRISQDYWVSEAEDGTKPETYRELEVIPKAMVRRYREFEVTDAETEAVLTHDGLYPHGPSSSELYVPPGLYVPPMGPHRPNLEGDVLVKSPLPKVTLVPKVELISDGKR